jgi:flagellar assembly protein FliH
MLFADNFDMPVVETAPALVAAAEPPPPTYTQADLDVACAQARAEGYAEASAQAAEAEAVGVSTALARIGEQLADAAAEAARVVDEGIATMARLLMSAMLAGYPQLHKLHGAEELRAVIRQAMPGLLHETRVVFHVHPSMVELVEAELANVRHNERQHMTIEPSEAIPPGDARIAWPNGAAVRDTEAIHAAIAEILRPLGLLVDPASAVDDPEAR